MIRTKGKNRNLIYKKSMHLPDAIYASTKIPFAQIPIPIIRDPEIPSNAKIVLCLLLSNTIGWTSYQSALLSHIKEGRTWLSTSLQQLEELGYLLRLQYRDKTTKAFGNTFWAYTTTKNQFDLVEYLSKLDVLGYELTPNSTKKYMRVRQMYTGSRFPGTGEPDSKYINIIYNKRKKSSNNDLLEVNDYIFTSNKFIKKWAQWKETRFKVDQFIYKSSISEKAAQKKLYNLSNKKEKTAIKIIEQSIAEQWKGFFPLKKETTYSSNKYVKNNKKSKDMEISPEQIINKKGGKYPRELLKTYEVLFDKSDDAFISRIEGSHTSIANALCDLHASITKARSPNAFKETKHSSQIGTTSNLIKDYIYWLKKEKWIDNISERVFSFDHSFFKRFIKNKSAEIGLNVITGRYN